MRVLEVYAAGSLRGAVTAIAKDFELRTGRKVALTFGASGLLRERIEKGEGARVWIALKPRMNLPVSGVDVHSRTL